MKKCSLNCERKINCVLYWNFSFKNDSEWQCKNPDLQRYLLKYFFKKFEYFKSEMTKVLIIILRMLSRQVSMCVVMFLSPVLTLFGLGDQFLYDQP